MSRIAFFALGLCSLVITGAFTRPAPAGDYYTNSGYDGDGYNRGYRSGYNGGNARYSSDCCYRKVVRYERSVRYVPATDYRREGYYDRPNYRDGYYSRSSYSDNYYNRPSYRSSSYYGTPRYDRGYGAGYTTRNYGAYDSYNSSDECARRTLADGHGSWVWSVKAGCN